MVKGNEVRTCHLKTREAGGTADKRKSVNAQAWEMLLSDRRREDGSPSYTNRACCVELSANEIYDLKRSGRLD